MTTDSVRSQLERVWELHTNSATMLLCMALST